MNRNNVRLSCGVGAVALMGLGWLGRPIASAAQSPVGAGSTIVHSKFGGQIFGFDVDQNGTEGVLSEALFESNGNVLAAIETFDQKTDKIIKVVQETQTQDDFITLGVVGNSVGLIQHQHVVNGFAHDLFETI